MMSVHTERCTPYRDETWRFIIHYFRHIHISWRIQRAVIVIAVDRFLAIIFNRPYVDDGGESGERIRVGDKILRVPLRGLWETNIQYAFKYFQSVSVTYRTRVTCGNNRHHAGWYQRSELPLQPRGNANVGIYLMETPRQIDNSKRRRRARRSSAPVRINEVKIEH